MYEGSKAVRAFACCIVMSLRVLLSRSMAPDIFQNAPRSSLLEDIRHAVQTLPDQVF